MALGFGLGSVCFSVGTVMVWLSRGAIATNFVFAVGAIFFTAAAAVQLAAAERRAPHAIPGVERRVRHYITNPDWMSSIIQLVGTLYFNAMTILALGLSLGQPNINGARIWDPDLIGSILFLISSWVAWHPIARERRQALLHGRALWANASNMLGSIFFGISAWGADPTWARNTENIVANNWGTFLGGLAFLLGSALSWPSNQPDEQAASN